MTQAVVVSSPTSTALASCSAQPTVVARTPSAVAVVARQTEHSTALTRVPDTAVVTLHKPQQAVLVVRGVPGPGAAPEAVYEAGQDLSGHRMVLLDTLRRAVYADSSVPSHASVVLGLTRRAAQAGAAVALARDVEVYEPSWSWVPGGVIYLGSQGALTQAPPQTPDAVFSLPVGWATAPSRMFVSIGMPIFLS